MKDYILLSSLIADPDKDYLWIMPNPKELYYVMNDIKENLPKLPKAYGYHITRDSIRIKGFKGGLYLLLASNKMLLSWRYIASYKLHKITDIRTFDRLTKMLDYRTL